MVGSQCKTSLRSKNNHPPRKSYHCLRGPRREKSIREKFGASTARAPQVIRHKYDIPGQCCSESGPCCTCDNEGVVDDCCCSFWCGCCATAQIARHEYAIPATGTVRYDCCSATGEP